MSAPHPLDAYRQMLRDILDHGIRRPNRTGEDTLFQPGVMLKFDMAQGFPAFTARAFAFKSMVGELLGFFRGANSAADFRALGCKVWDSNANTTPSWLANPHRKGTDDLGPVYGAQWTAWRDWRVARTAEETFQLRRQGFETVASGFTPERDLVTVMQRRIHQLENSLRTLLTNPTDRRNVITAWNPAEHDLMALPACHMTYTWMADTAGNRLHLSTHMRSWDAVLAFNIQLSSLFLHIMARLSGMEPGTVTLFVDDAHIYMNHIPGLQEMLSREEHPLPTLRISDRVKRIEKVEQVPGVFAGLEPSDFALENYVHEPKIVFQMAA